MPDPSQPSNISALTAAARESLIAQARAGDKAAFGTLCELTRPLLERHLVAILGDRSLAQEISQSTFTKAFHKLKDTKPTRLYWRAWIYTIANNIVRDMWRRDRILKTFSIDEKVQALEDSDIDTWLSLSGATVVLGGSATASLDPALIYEARAAKEASAASLNAMLKELDPMSARLLMLSASSMTYAQIAASLDISTADVKAGLARARRDARAILATLPS